MIYTLLSPFFFIAGIAGLSLSLVIMCRKENLSKRLMLSLSIFCLSLGSMYNFLLMEGRIYSLPEAVVGFKSFSWLIAPCAFLYVRNVIYDIERIKWYDWLHFVPFFYSLICILFSIYEKPGHFNITDNVSFWSINNMLAAFGFYSFSVIKILIAVLYSFLQMLIVLKFESRNWNESTYNLRVLTWLKVYTLMSMALFISLLVQTISNGQSIGFEFSNNALMAVILVTVVLWLLFRSKILFKVENIVLADVNENTEMDKNNNVINDKENGQVIPDEKVECYYNILEKIFKDEQPFLKPGFLIRDLSQMSNIPIHHLSYVINTKYNLHFQDFINLKRIEYLKNALNTNDWKNLSLEGMAWQVGFKSRTTFFRAFIKLTGQSPSEYIKSRKLKYPLDYQATA